MLVGKVDASKSVVRAIPDSPLSRRFHTLSMEWPIGVTQPIPVMTTRFMAWLRVHFLEHQRRVLSPEAVDGADGDVEVRVAGLRSDVQPHAVQRLARVDG